MENVLKTSFRLDIKDILLIGALLFGIYHFLLKPEREVITEKEKTTVDIKKEIEAAINSQLQLQQPVQQPTIIYKDRVVPIYKNTPIAETDKNKIKNLNKYSDTTYLEHAKIHSEILSDGIVYSNKITAEVDVKTITKIKEKKIVKYGSGFYFSPSVYMNPNTLDYNFGIALEYLNKGDFGAGVGVQYNTNDGGIYYGISLKKKIF